LEEQARIIDKIDELMLLCDNLGSQGLLAVNAQQRMVDQFLKSLLLSSDAKEFLENWHNISNNFETLFTSTDSIESLKLAVLEMAITGKLAPQEPVGESASHLLEKISESRSRLFPSEGRKKKGSTSSSDGMKGNGRKLPSNWIWTTLDAVYDVRDGTHDTPKYYEIGYPLVTSKNLYSGALDFSDTKFISEEDYLKIKKRSEVNFGDILFAMIGTIGNPVIVETEREFSIKNIALFKPYLSEHTEMKYLLIFLKYITAELKENAAGAVQSFVSLGMLRSYPFPLPPLEEQKRISNKVDEIFTICDQLKMFMKNSNKFRCTIADSMVEHALA
jgi:type I restriction enzyme S subunit